MKKIIQIAVLIFIVTSCKAQTPVLDLHTAGFKDIENGYYKDIENFYGQFVGTWVYSDNSKTIRFKFIKKEIFYRRSVINCYVDYLVVGGNFRKPRLKPTLFNKQNTKIRILKLNEKLLWQSKSYSTFL